MAETFAEVIAEMVGRESGSADEAYYGREDWRRLIVRLRDAHERESLSYKIETSANQIESVADVCADARRTSTEWIRTMNVLGVMPTRECVYDWTRRVFDAHNREMSAKDSSLEIMRVEFCAAQARFDEAIAEKDAEIARLKTEVMALRRVIGVDRCVDSDVCLERGPKDDCENYDCATVCKAVARMTKGVAK